MFSHFYFHFPFCETKCHYCDFYSIGAQKTKSTDADLFEKSLIKEIEIRMSEIQKTHSSKQVVKTIFMGGGTPSMTPPESMARIFESFFQFATLDSDYEWTMEANPSSITLDKFKKYKSLGINRVSMGVQSLKDTHLSSLGRVHNEAEAIEALNAVFESGFSNVSTDLLCGVPGQTLDDLGAHIEKLTSFPITHLSIYLLTLPPHHAMFKDLPNEDEQLKHLLFIDQKMKEKGFIHYEISNFSKNRDLRARHNLAYWTQKSYLSFGPSAHSYNSEMNQRFKNYSSLHKWSKALLEEEKVPTEWSESLSEEQLSLEKWMLTLRLDDGFPKNWINTQNQIYSVKNLQNENMIEEHPSDETRFRLTPKGFAMSDSIISQLSKA